MQAPEAVIMGNATTAPQHEVGVRALRTELRTNGDVISMEVKRIMKDAAEWSHNAWEHVEADRTWGYDQIVSVKAALIHWKAMRDYADAKTVH